MEASHIGRLASFRLWLAFQSSKENHTTKAKLNSLLDDASGKFGDRVFARNPSGLYLRELVDPDQPNSDRQTSVRDRFSLFASHWATITEAQRTGWNNLAGQVTKTGKYGDLYNPTGH